MAVSIRAARESDAADIARLTEQLGYTATPSEIGARLSTILARPDDQFFVAEHSGQAVGWLHATICRYVEADPFVVIGGLVVDSNHRRQGIGRMLMERAEQWAGERGCSIVRLSSSAGRAGAHRFYEKIGYRNIKTQYAFAKIVGSARQEDLQQFVPRLDVESG